jgi:hypothetical protein
MPRIATGYRHQSTSAFFFSVAETHLPVIAADSLIRRNTGARKMDNRIETTRALMLVGLVMSSAAFAVTASAPAHAASKNAPLSARVNGAYGSAVGSVSNGVQGTTVYSRGRYVGRDPDPAVRAQLLRDDFRDRSM